jgi:putative ABC transport system permease protein
MSSAGVVGLAASNLLLHGLRTALSVTGVGIGVAAVLLLTALGEGARGYVLGEFEGLGSDVLAILPGKLETSGGMPGITGVPNDLTLADARAVEAALSEVVQVVPLTLGNDTVSRSGRARAVVVIGSTTGLAPVRGLEVASGRFLPEGEWRRAAPLAVIGATVARELFDGESALGGKVRLGGWRLRVIGVLESRGVHFGVDMDDVVIVPVATAMQIFDESSLFRIAAQLRPGSSMERAGNQATRVLLDRHGEEDFTVTTPDAVIESLGSILDTLTLALVGIALISLSVAGIGVMNVMLVSVSERTAEVGLLKAIGARPDQILTVFLVEAALLAGVGGVAGVVAGASLVELVVGFYPGFPARVPGWAVVSALLVSVVVGVVFGVLPARRAVGLDPVVALARGLA